MLRLGARIYRNVTRWFRMWLNPARHFLTHRQAIFIPLYCRTRHWPHMARAALAVDSYPDLTLTSTGNLPSSDPRSPCARVAVLTAADDWVSLSLSK